MYVCNIGKGNESDSGFNTKETNTSDENKTSMYDKTNKVSLEIKHPTHFILLCYVG